MSGGQSTSKEKGDNRLVRFDYQNQDVRDPKRQKIKLNAYPRSRCLESIGNSIHLHRELLWVDSEQPPHIGSTGEHQNDHVQEGQTEHLKKKILNQGNLKKYDSENFTITENGIQYVIKREELSKKLKEVSH